MGAASGYISALIVQLLTMMVILKFKQDPNVDSLITPIKAVIGIVGLWWLVFQIPVQLFLKSRASPDLKLDHIRKPIYGDPNYIRKLVVYDYQLFKAYLFHGYKTLFLALKQARQLQDICSFLLGWFIISDALTTINSTAILFAKTDLKMSTLQLSQIGVLTMVSAIGGSILIPNTIQHYFKWTIKQALIFIILWATVIPIYVITGFFIESLGLHHWIEMYFLAIWYGFSLGGVATLSRSFYSMLIPKGQESVFFALYSITDKGSSIMGPFLVGIVIDYTHEIRKCFWLLLALLVVSIPIFSYVDIERGIQEAAVLQSSEDEEN
ncbi:unnamed protein product [Ambrosiozyma monospora]|uniref:Unnamed protein product n=1 Tax=Ambrosiozyma monospora TaxID=43982 RepID=A0ACB5TC92_AMBMO|nr:unnamed protein product [Ambrosiozyma monospora]